MYFKGFLVKVLMLAIICDTYKILLVTPYPSKSHAILGESITDLLLEVGHEVTYITPNPIEHPHSNLTQIVIKPYEVQEISIKLLGKSMKFQDIFDLMLNITYAALTDINVQRLMEDTTQTFDLVIAERLYIDVYSGLSAVFNCPHIWFFSFQNDQEIMRLFHEAPSPSLTANLRTNNVPPFSFIQRVQELLYLISSTVWRYLYYDPIDTKTYENLFRPVFSKRGRDLPPYEAVRYNASLAFSTSHLTLRDSPLMLQNYKAVGGLHISETTKPMSEELLSIIEHSDKDVVVFSFGSILKAEELSNNIKTDLLEMFSKLNYTILWKIDEHLKDLPSNVWTFPWIPLQSILAHPKCILHINHGGIFSIAESVHYGVPLVGIPVFGDQTVNIKTLVKRGVARMVTMSPKLVDDLKKAIEDVLGDPRYKENMKTLSSLYHDRPVPPRLELVHWVEHVIVTRGAPHRRSPALLVPWYEKCYIDLAAALLAFLIGFILLLKICFVYIIGKVKVLFNRNNKMLKNIKSL